MSKNVVKKAVSMQCARSMFLNHRNVLLRSISFVSFEPIEREASCMFYHQSIARDFGNDARGGNARFQVISANDGAVRIVEPEMIATIHKQVRRRNFLSQHRERLVHGFLGRGKNADAVDVVMRTHANAPCAVARDPVVRQCSFIGFECFAVGDDAVVGA